MTPEQAAAVARVRDAVEQANLCMPSLSTIMVAKGDAAAILAALDAAQAPREVPSQDADEAALARLRKHGAVAWADVPDAAAWVDEQRGASREVPRLTRKCSRPKCDGDMLPGVAMAQTWGGVPDFPGVEVVTMSPGGPGRVVHCLKCTVCGHSVTQP